MPHRDRSAEFLRGLEAYRGGQHYEAHEHWEAIWHDEQDPDRNRLLQALIQIASAVHKAKNDVAPRGSLQLTHRALSRLEGLPDDYLGIDLPALRAAVNAFQAAVAMELDRHGSHCRLGDEHVPPIRTIGPTPGWLQGPPSPTVPDAARRAWFDRGLDAYQAGDYFEAHELWEELWRDQPSSETRPVLQGLIQVAAAMHKAHTQRKPGPAARLLERALAKLARAAPDAFGLDVRRLVREARHVHGQLLAPEADAGDPPRAPAIARLR